MNTQFYYLKVVVRVAFTLVLLFSAVAIAGEIKKQSMHRKLTVDEAEAFVSLIHQDDAENFIRELQALPIDEQERIISYVDAQDRLSIKTENKLFRAKLLADNIVQMVQDRFHLSDEEIIAKQDFFNVQSGSPEETMIVTKRGDYFYYHNTAEILPNLKKPATKSAQRRYINGSQCEFTHNGAMCWQKEVVATFYLPTCAREISPGQFDTILDAWAEPINCLTVIGCVNMTVMGPFYSCSQCGQGWDGAGNKGWWNFKSCGSNTSKKVGKQIQKRWYYAWKCYNLHDDDVARKVTALIQW